MSRAETAENPVPGQISLAAIVFMAALLPPVPAAVAQDNRPYAGGGAMLSTQKSVSPAAGEGPSFPKTGIGGRAVGVSGEIGTFIARAVSLTFEVSVPARFDSVQETDHGFLSRTANQHRDIVLSGLFHLHRRPSSRVGVALVAGPSVIREDTLQREASQIGSSSSGIRTVGPFGPQSPLLRWTVGVTTGADVGIRISPRLQIVPQIRVHWIDRGRHSDFRTDSLGLGSVVIRPAVAVRATL
jgi:hypothetical protein